MKMWPDLVDIDLINYSPTRGNSQMTSPPIVGTCTNVGLLTPISEDNPINIRSRTPVDGAKWCDGCRTRRRRWGLEECKVERSESCGLIVTCRWYQSSRNDIAPQELSSALSAEETGTLVDVLMILFPQDGSRQPRRTLCWPRPFAILCLHSSIPDRLVLMTASQKMAFIDNRANMSRPIGRTVFDRSPRHPCRRVHRKAAQDSTQAKHL